MQKIIDRRSFLKTSGLGALGLAALRCNRPYYNPLKSKPNIVLIMADDMGFSDLGCYGGEIQTPNIDQLAEKGLRYTQFYNASRCCPTRASLLTGLYAHQTGMGWMTAADLGSPGYTGDINRNCVTLAEVLKQAGYSTYLSGKWHVTHDRYMKPSGPKHNWPLQRGFDRYYGPLDGGGSYFHTKVLVHDNESLPVPEKEYYVTDAISEYASKYITEHAKGKSEQPFFLYVGYTAPHFPLHAKPEDIEKYKDLYTRGWEIVRAERYSRLIELGIIDEEWQLPGFEKDIQSWDKMSNAEKQHMVKRMAIYAAQIDNMDQGIGQIVTSLKETGQYDNTLILFLSDNGGSAEFISRGDKSYEALGTASSYESVRKPWATASNTPFRKYKQWEHEGGTATPLIVHWPEQIRSHGELRHQVGHVIDFMPTFIDVTGADYPDQYINNKIIPMEGVSLVPTFDNKSIQREALYWEHQATRAIRMGQWKLVADSHPDPPYEGKWELYNMETDRTETHNLAEQYPDRVEMMAEMWHRWAVRCRVYPLDGRGWFPRLEK